MHEDAPSGRHPWWLPWPWANPPFQVGRPSTPRPLDAPRGEDRPWQGAWLCHEPPDEVHVPNVSADSNTREHEDAP